MSAEEPLLAHRPIGPWTPGSPPQAAAPRPYPQVLRGPAHRWWRGLLAMVMAVSLGTLAAVVIGLAAVVVLFAQGAIDLLQDAELSPEELTARLIEEPVMFLANNLILAALIPISLLSVWACHQWRPRWVSSVAPGLRWKWLGAAFLVSVPCYALVHGVTFAVDGGLDWQVDSRAITLVVIILLTTPLQAAGEEYMFRGLLTQAIGSWFARPLAAVAASGVATGLMFAALHGLGTEQDGWLFLGRFAYGIAFSYLTWQTGGLEAAIAVHSVNNMSIMLPMALSGGLGAAVAQSESSAGGVGLSVVVIVVVGGLLVALGRRLGLQRVHDPARQPGGPGPGSTARRPDHRYGQGPFIPQPRSEGSKDS